MNRPSIKIRDRQHLIDEIARSIKEHGPTCDLNHFDVSDVTDFTHVFSIHENWIFNGNMSKWDTRNMKDATGMFKNSRFNGDIENWNVSKLSIMTSMFQGSYFEGSLHKWRPQPHADIENLFKESRFNGNINDWAMKPLACRYAFAWSKFNKSLDQWDITGASERFQIVGMLANTKVLNIPRIHEKSITRITNEITKIFDGGREIPRQEELSPLEAILSASGRYYTNSNWSIIDQQKLELLMQLIDPYTAIEQCLHNKKIIIEASTEYPTLD